jgi:hypothetical protein
MNLEIDAPRMVSFLGRNGVMAEHVKVMQARMSTINDAAID